MSKVVKLAQPGYDVKTAKDENLIYNSNWPLLKIFKSGKFKTNNTKARTEIILNHNLGFTPMVMYFSNWDIRGWDGGSNGLTSSARSEFQGQLPGANIAVDANNLYYFSYGTISSASVEIEYYIYALDITTNYTAPITKLGTQTAAGKGGKVFKIAKPNEDISSTHLKDYVIHSNARSPLIHSVTAGPIAQDSSVLSGRQTTTYHKLGYLPMFFVYKSSPLVGYPDAYIQQFGTLNAFVGVTADTQKVAWKDTGAFPLSIIILKDPFLIDYTVRVNV